MKKVIILILVIVTLGGILASPIFHISNFNIVYISELAPEQILAMIDDQHPNIFAFNRRQAVAAIAQSPAVYRVTISKSYINRQININITERRTVGYVRFSQSQYLQVDNTGLVLSVANYRSLPRPIVAGLDFTTFMVGERLEVAGHGVFQTMATMAGIFLAYDIDMDALYIDITDPSNLRLNYGNIIISLGPPQDLEEKIRILIPILPELALFRTIGGHLDISDINAQWVFRILT
ncbi:MAG: FtsQ-type POTRA domain-containing protein [Defluviitaleaceae bacterium]|nr:FtsQ-type POTRA domain-containing protein [Defluviitaleaceae bacterium]